MSPELHKRIFSIGENEQLRRRIGASKEAQAFYHLACETMIGLALGRATTQGSAPLAHEKTVIEQLRALARKVTR